MILFDAYDLVNCGQYDTVMNPIGSCFFLWTMDDAQSAWSYLIGEEKIYEWEGLWIRFPLFFYWTVFGIELAER